MSDTIEKQLQELRELRTMSFIDDETKAQLDTTIEMVSGFKSETIGNKLPIF